MDATQCQIKGVITMATVTQIIKQMTAEEIQRFIKVDDFKKTQYRSNSKLYRRESIPAYLSGVIIDYLTRYKLLKDPTKAFSIPLIVDIDKEVNGEASKLVSQIKKFDKESVDIALKLCRYDNYYRTGKLEDTAQYKLTEHDYFNLGTMVNRATWFINSCIDKTKILEVDIEFDGAYTNKVTNGDADYLTNKVLIDLKTSAYEPKSADAFQLLLYYVLGINSNNSYKFEKLTHLAIFNPRLNAAYTLPLSSISKRKIEKVEKFIGYDEEIELSDALSHFTGGYINTSLF